MASFSGPAGTKDLDRYSPSFEKSAGVGVPVSSCFTECDENPQTHGGMFVAPQGGIP
jgi:hypothetical protein